jgi:hypothetical protein
MNSGSSDVALKKEMSKEIPSSDHQTLNSVGGCPPYGMMAGSGAYKQDNILVLMSTCNLKPPCGQLSPSGQECKHPQGLELGKSSMQASGKILKCLFKSD